MVSLTLPLSNLLGHLIHMAKLPADCLFLSLCAMLRNNDNPSQQNVTPVN